MSEKALEKSRHGFTASICFILALSQVINQKNDYRFLQAKKEGVFQIHPTISYLNHSLFSKENSTQHFAQLGTEICKNVFEPKKDVEIVVNKSWHGKFDNRDVRRQDATVLQ